MSTIVLPAVVQIDRHSYLQPREPLGDFKGSGVRGQTMESIASTQSKARWKQMGKEEKKALVHEEMRRMNQLPANSTYATHRLRVLSKMLQLMTTQRTVSQDEELELLFAGLHL